MSIDLQSQTGETATGAVHTSTPHERQCSFFIAALAVLPLSIISLSKLSAAGPVLSLDLVAGEGCLFLALVV